MEEIAKSLQEISTCQQMITAILILAFMIRFLMWLMQILEENEINVKKRKKEEKEEIKKEIIEYYEQTNKKEK